MQEVNGYNGALDSYEVHEFDDDFFDNYIESKQEAARAVFFGNIHNWMDEYIRFNGYGNLESLNSYQYAKELEEGANEIITEALELVKSGDIDIDYLTEDLEA